MSNLEVKINVEQEIELHEKKDELVTSPPQQQPAAAGNGSNEEKDKNRKSPPPQDQDRMSNPEVQINVGPEIKASRPQQEPEERRNRHSNLYLSAFQGDWDAAKLIYENYPDDFRAVITGKGETVLHVAASANRTDFVKELLNFLVPKDLRKVNENGQTALFLAAEIGNAHLVQLLLAKNKDLAMIRNREKIIPLQRAASLGHKDVVNSLYKVTDTGRLRNVDRISLLITFINTNFYELALDLIEHFPGLAYARGSGEETALHALARKRFIVEDQQGFWKRFINLISGSKKKMHPKAVELAERIWQQIIKLGDAEISELLRESDKLLFTAAEKGNDEFLVVLTNKYPRLFLNRDAMGWSIFHHAVRNRHEDILRLIYELGSFKTVLAALIDRDGNNMLHLAAMLAPPDRLSVVSGEALQMQRELLWFKEVSKVVQPSYAEAKNDYGKTPADVFAEEHRKLADAGEKWIKETANSCMIVATLITSVVYTAVFQVPIDNKRDSRVPILIQKVSFAISLISSLTSIMIFLSLYTSSYEDEDFLFWLPAKLAFGTLALSMSIAAMMVISCSTFFIIFDHGMLAFAIIVSLIAAVPLTWFLKLQLGLLLKVIRSTYMSSTLFHSRKPILFNKEGARESTNGKKKN
ncbi:uncharacterized protein LOC123226865 isoform X4 [Mangifera indica]|uniref:uncharacterized protein LOC123226865 isoform X4 n=1 Tax=Mangifera indica TaxID=29780 RepID=UPI001CFA45BF|nr:uncharacterized protein LOC123226865 isoform X4 [Mangifera indica]